MEPTQELRYSSRIVQFIKGAKMKKLIIVVLLVTASLIQAQNTLDLSERSFARWVITSIEDKALSDSILTLANLHDTGLVPVEGWTSPNGWEKFVYNDTYDVLAKLRSHGYPCVVGFAYKATGASVWNLYISFAGDIIVSASGDTLANGAVRTQMLQIIDAIEFKR